MHACKHCALCRAVTCRRHSDGQRRRPSTGAAGCSRRLGGGRPRVIKRRAPREHSLKVANEIRHDWGSRGDCQMQSALGVGLRTRRPPTMSSAVVSVTTSRALAWCSPFRPAPTTAPRPSAAYASRTELPVARRTATPAEATRLSDCHWSFVFEHCEASAIKQHAAPRAQAPSSASNC